MGESVGIYIGNGHYEMASACEIVWMLALFGPTTYTMGWRYWDCNGYLRIPGLRIRGYTKAKWDLVFSLIT